MLVRLSELELRALSALCGGSFPAKGLASRLNAKKSLASRLLRSLGAKGLLSVERRGTEKIVSLSSAQHAQAFRRLRESRPNVQVGKWLSGSALDALVVMSDGGAPMARLARECACSKTTLYRVLRLLRAAGVASFDGRVYRVTDALVGAFANSFADFVLQSVQGKLDGKFKVSVRMRKHVVIRADAKAVPPFFAATGLPSFAGGGIEFVRANYSDYYFNLDELKPQLSPEERFVHALVLATVEFVNKPLLAVVFKKHKFDAARLRGLAKDYAVEGELEKLRIAVSYYEKLRDYE